MKNSQQFRKFFIAWKNCFESVKLTKILLLFVVYACLQIAIVLMFIFYAYPPLSGVLVPIIKHFFGEQALHYPNNYVLLPTLFNWTNILLSGFLGVLIIGVSTKLFSLSYRNKAVELGKGFRSIGPKYLVLLAVWFVETFCLLGVLFGAPKLLVKIGFLAHQGSFSIQLITALLAILLGAMFAYTTALIILDGNSMLKAVARSLVLFKKYPIVSFLLIAVPTFIHMPFDLLTSETHLLISKFMPEIVGVLLIISILISVFTNYFLVGTVTRYFLLVTKQQQKWL